MATRYVWDQYNTNYNAFSDPRTTSAASFSTSYFTISYAQPQANMLITGQFANMPFYEGSGSNFTVSGTAKDYSVSAYGKYLYFPAYGNSIMCVFPDAYMDDMEDYDWRVGSHVWIVNRKTGVQISFNTYKPAVTKGDGLLGQVSSNKSNGYPAGYDGSAYWNVYRGSEVIDPTGISLTSSKIVPGQTAAAIIEAPASQFDGVYYHVAYSANGGSYQNLPDVTAHSFTFTVPNNADSLRLRVQAEVPGSGVVSEYVYSGYYYANEAPSAPSSVTIPLEIYPEREFSVKWPAAVDPDGNLSGYEVQRAYNGSSSWSDVARTTNTSVSATVSREYETVQFRVRAYDTNGAYSDWTYSDTATIHSMRAYIGINGKARRVNKIYVGINGKARQVVKGYIGVNGKARRFL